ncbi:hypothetical protein [Actinomadura sp. SCN-SB]|uniref:hypothetical protein n=1 Tax=Actinomadura sp. SCN-SB TaxID=3373092 RepID=UPI0037529F74
MQPRVIGLDLSLTATGMALPDGSLDVIVPAKGLTGVARLQAIRAEIFRRILPPATDLAVIEGPAYSRAAGAGHHEAAGLWWLVVYEMTARGVHHAIVPPTTLKRYATGKGTATKADMRMALYRREDRDVRDDNMVDARWLALMGLDHLGHPLVEVPKTHRDALAKVAWPEVTRGTA